MSRTDARSTALRHRPTRTVPATIVSVLLLLLGVGLVWVAVLRLLDGRWPAFLGSVNGWLAGLTWGAALTLVICAGVALLGLVLLLTAIVPGKPNALTVTDQADDTGDGPASTDYVMTRRSVAKLAAAHADLVDGVDKVNATAGPRRVQVHVATASEQTADIQRTVTDRVTQALAAAGLKPMPRVTTTARTTKP